MQPTYPLHSVSLLLLLLLLLLPALLTHSIVLPPPQLPLQSSQTPTSSNTLGAVASENIQCSRIGISLLQAGGTAADALVGTVFCIGVVDCHHSGIGGGGFAIAKRGNGIREASGTGTLHRNDDEKKGKEYEVVDFRETAPSGSWEGMFKNNVRRSLFGGMASATPGEVRGLQHIHGKYGKLPWEGVMQPAIALARDGFEVSDDFERAMVMSSMDSDFLTKDPLWAIDFAPNGTRVGRGDVITRKRYAKTLESIARDGADAFYTGPIADATIRAIQKEDGIITRQDLRKYAVMLRRPVEIGFKGNLLYSCGVPASGAVTLSALKILEGYDDIGDEMGDLSTHRMVEAMRFGFGKRASFGDPAWVADSHKVEREMLSEEFAAATRAKISDEHTLKVSAYNPEGFEILPDHGTSHVVTADASGMAFSLTTTINTFFGSRVMVPETGVILNNEMNDFSIPNISNFFGYYPSPANYARPGARSLSSISPIIASHPNGTLHTVFGASGGSRIITATIQNARHIFSAKLRLADALEKPRLHDQLIPNEAMFEKGYDEGTMDFMRSRGHDITCLASGSSAQAIRVEDGRFEAMGEPRQRDSGGLTT